MRVVPKHRGRRQPILGPTATIATVIGLLVVALPTAMVLFVGFLPTLVAWLVDETSRRYSTRTVAGLNFVGVAPFVLKLWSSGYNDIAGAGRLITDPFAIVVMFGTAAIGWLMFLGFPGVVAAFSTINANRRIAQIKERQRALVEEWGTAIASQERREIGHAGQGPSAPAPIKPSEAA
ncbi:MAG TPA: hypothetical protein VIM38_09240 [Alphaproteobacteria bacterium]